MSSESAVQNVEELPQAGAPELTPEQAEAARGACATGQHIQVLMGDGSVRNVQPLAVDPSNPNLR